MDNLFLLIWLLSIIAIVIFGILAIVKFIKKEKEQLKKQLICAGISVVIMIASFIAFGFTIDESSDKNEKVVTKEKVENDKSQKETVKNESENKETKPVNSTIATENKETKPVDSTNTNTTEKKEKEQTVEEKESLEKHQENINKNTLSDDMKSIIKKAIGKKNNRDQNYIDDVKVENSNLTIILNADDNFTPNMIKTGILMKTDKVLKAIEKEHKFEIITVMWKFPLVDTYGNKSNEEVLRISLNRETLNKINWDNFDYNNFEKIANNYFEHPAFNK